VHALTTAACPLPASTNRSRLAQYYYGSHQQSQHAGVQYILDSVVASLLRNSDRKFTYVEVRSVVIFRIAASARLGDRPNTTACFPPVP
jgi:hypothetical protein